MKRLIFILITLSSVSVSAQSDEAARSSKHNGYATLGINSGGLTFGAGYENMIDVGTGLTGGVRWFSKDDKRPANGLFIFGGGVAHHFYKKHWDLAFTPSMNVINIDTASRAQDDVTTLGPGLSISLLWQASPRIAIGFDNTRYWVWFDDDYSGTLIDDLSVRMRASF